MDGYLDKYFDMFGEDFPLMQAPNKKEAIEHIMQCINQNKTAEKLYPQYYGARSGYLI